MLGWTAVGWLMLVAWYAVGHRVFGVVGPFNAAIVGFWWLWAIVIPLVGAIRLLRRGRPRRPGLALMVAATASATTLAVMGPPGFSPESHFWLHRGQFAEVAAQYGSGSAGAFDLPWPLNALSFDGQVHRQCSSSIDRCLLYLAAWQDWRAETGVGFAHIKGDASAVVVVTASGDLGQPTRALGDGWWWIE